MLEMFIECRGVYVGGGSGRGGGGGRRGGGLVSTLPPRRHALALPAAPVEGGRGGLRRTLQVLAAKVTRVKAKQG